MEVDIQFLIPLTFSARTSCSPPVAPRSTSSHHLYVIGTYRIEYHQKYGPSFTQFSLATISKLVARAPKQIRTNPALIAGLEELRRKKKLQETIQPSGQNPDELQVEAEQPLDNRAHHCNELWHGWVLLSAFGELRHDLEFQTDCFIIYHAFTAGMGVVAQCVATPSCAFTILYSID